VDDPPTAEKGAEPHGHLTAQHDPKGNVKLIAELAVRKEQHGNDPHRLLCVVSRGNKARRRQIGGYEKYCRPQAESSAQKSMTPQEPETKPRAGENTTAEPVLIKPLQTMVPMPALAIPAPTSPPISACELDEGMPRAQVNRFQLIAHINAPKMT
jgi:hypothetical protein